MMSTNSDILSSKAYLGHPKNQSNPKTREFWIGEFNGMVVFDPEKMQQQLDQAKKAYDQAKKDNKDVLIICEKELYRDEVEKLAEKAGVHYLNYKVPA
ncbi:MAG: 30S ribosomal protein S2 [Candidatus Peribacteria bacterium]|nr:MAG: 30S ribosomal protein S2 [Candidatus Peribacteria bacterium]